MTTAGCHVIGQSGNEALVPSTATDVHGARCQLVDKAPLQRMRHRFQAIVRAKLSIDVMKMVAQGLR